MNESTVMSALKTLLQGMANFANADVTICDWSILDGAVTNAPYAIIEPSDNFEMRFRVETPEITWEPYITIYEAFTDWGTTLAALQALREAVLTAIQAGTGTLGLTLRYLRSAQPISQVYQVYTDPQDTPEALPVFLAAKIAVGLEEF